MDGIIVVNKEKNYTSRDIVNIVGKHLKTKKVGHTGTLDPLATGVLVICVGKATKLVELLTNHDKTYIADLTFGIDTDTLDSTGNILNEENTIIEKDKIEKVLKQFEIEYDQTVPIYSAVKINGKKLYEYARNNEEVILPSRKVKIYEIDLLKYEIVNNKTTIQIKCKVSKGTYIRSLIRDIATTLNSFAIMTDLKRTELGEFNIENSYTLNDIEQNNYQIISIEEALKNYKTVEVTGNVEFKIKNGCKINNIYNEKYILFKSKQEILGLYKDIDGILKPYKMFL